MGAKFSKTAEKGEVVAEKPGEAAASTSKTNGQENGHVKANGDSSPTAEEAGPDGEQANGSAQAKEGAELAEAACAEEEGGEEAAVVSGEGGAPVAEGDGSAKAEDDAASSSDSDKKKKKRFSFKKPFKLSGFTFKKTKKEEGENEGGEEEEEEEKGEATGEGAGPGAAPEGEGRSQKQRPLQRRSP
ncbi:hypothetical protein AAFF_G00311040 [Aldrovandia affinis]|uniref:Myristoylated alanine-rich C-kinase substrate n=1 Tax=Aldrovandia affinis TaxID=143900 RepID=A0AAD7R870_9TELE|nr:hypothetical protein AAFF_G00311040 [Aldrovandia affinis]